MRGILFGGCSFTWGQGLYFYSDLPRIFNPPPYQYHADKVTDAHVKFIETIRYPRLVANHFKTFEVVKKINGGSEDQTFDFFKYIFETERTYNYDDFSYIIVQLSQLYRNKFYFEHNGIFQNSILWPNVINMIHENQDLLIEWMSKNNYSLEDWIKLHKEAQLKRLIKEFEHYELKGIKCRLLLWEDELLSNIKQISYLNNKFISFNYKNKTYNTIREMQLENKELFIEHDPYFVDIKYFDQHPSKLCHEIIAKNIIERIELETL